MFLFISLWLVVFIKGARRFLRQLQHWLWQKQRINQVLPVLFEKKGDGVVCVCVFFFPATNELIKEKHQHRVVF